MTPGATLPELAFAVGIESDEERAWRFCMGPADPDRLPVDMARFEATLAKARAERDAVERACRGQRPGWYR